MKLIPYVGVCMKEGNDGAEHKVVLHDELVRMYLSKMCEEGSPLYSPKYAHFMLGTASHVTPPKPVPKTVLKKKAVHAAIEAVDEDADADDDEGEGETPAPAGSGAAPAGSGSRTGTSLAALLADIK